MSILPVGQGRYLRGNRKLGMRISLLIKISFIFSSVQCAPEGPERKQNEHSMSPRVDMLDLRCFRMTWGNRNTGFKQRSRDSP